ncbi:MAG: hypothetical protein QOI74_1146 [Micromonosporaceae bacterium]|jgi:hypothetical protein|nr:hypothetical protein [Micromonosporaceae bacterium]MDT5038295.1 hypothetical protein [Micromonosporaceae bacterium]
MDGDTWPARRRRAIAAHGAALERQRVAEAEQARRLVADFARQALARRLRPAPLTARAYHGRSTYRTGLHGWYLRPDRSIAVSTDGAFYVLTVAPRLRARLTGARVEPGDPRLIVGAGARDGESMPLGALLQRRLDAGDTWP